MFFELNIWENISMFPWTRHIESVTLIERRDEQ